MRLQSVLIYILSKLKFKGLKLNIIGNSYCDFNMDTINQDSNNFIHLHANYILIIF